jgi:hypothetical protein
VRGLAPDWLQFGRGLVAVWIRLGWILKKAREMRLEGFLSVAGSVRMRIRCRMAKLLLF